MSTRSRLEPHKVMDGVSLGADAEGDVTDVGGVSIFSYTVVWTGNPTGLFEVYGCNDYDPVHKTGGNWDVLTTSPTVAPAGTASNNNIDVPLTGIRFVKLKYTRNGGTGTATATISGKAA